MLNFNFDNVKSVSFKVQNFCVPAQKKRRQKHMVYGNKSSGFHVRPFYLNEGFTAKKLEMETSVNRVYELRAAPEVPDGEVIKRVFCFQTIQDGGMLNAVLAVTDAGAYYYPIYANMPLSAIQAPVWDFCAFDQASNPDRDMVFAAAATGVYWADRWLDFVRIDLKCVPVDLKVFAGRLFVLDSDRNTVHFSAPLNMTDFSGEDGLSGTFKVDAIFGDIIGFDVFDGKLLIVQESGFTTLESAYDPSGFTLKTLARSYENIIAGTARVIDDTIFFLTNEGLCKCTVTGKNGRGRIRLLDIEIGAGWFRADMGALPSIVYENKYYLALDGRVLVIDKFYDSVSFIDGIQVRHFERIWNERGKHLAVLSGENPRAVFQFVRTESPAFKVWESDFFGLGYAATQQRIKQVLIKTIHPVDVIVCNEKDSRKYSMRGSPDIQRIMLNLKGEAFKIRLETYEPRAEVTSLTAVLGYDT